MCDCEEGILARVFIDSCWRGVPTTRIFVFEGLYCRPKETTKACFAAIVGTTTGRGVQELGFRFGSVPTHKGDSLLGSILGFSYMWKQPSVPRVVAELAHGMRALVLWEGTAGRAMLITNLLTRSYGREQRNTIPIYLDPPPTLYEGLSTQNYGPHIPGSGNIFPYPY